MTNKETRTPFSTLTSDQLRSFELDGYLIVQGLYSPAEIATVREVFMAQGELGPTAGLSDVPAKIDRNDPLSFYPRMMQPHKHLDKPVGPVALDYLLNPRLEPVLTELLGEEPLAAQTMFYFKPPGARGQELHQDNFYLRVSPGTCLAAWLAVDDVDEENGGMKVVPGTHRSDIACPEQADLGISFSSDYVPVPEGMQAVHANMHAGDVLFFNGSLIHGSTPNRSPNRFRRSLIAHYVPKSSEEVAHWYRPLLTFSRDEVSRTASSGGGPCGSVSASPH